MSLVSVSCPVCGASNYVSLPATHRFVTAEPDEHEGRDGEEVESVGCDSCETAFPVVHAPRRA